MPGNIRWFVPQDQAGLFATLGGDAATVAKLDAMFDFDNSKLDYSHAEDIAGLIGQYIHGNEPSHHVAYLYAYAGAPWRTQERLKQIVDSQYKPTPDGLSGNDDLGQMSAWLVFTALGFYPVAPGSERVCASAARSWTRATLNLPNGKRFTIDRRRPVDDQPLRRQGRAQRQAADAQLHPPRRDHGRRRTALHDAGQAEQELGDVPRGATLLDKRRGLGWRRRENVRAPKRKLRSGQPISTGFRVDHRA